MRKLVVTLVFLCMGAMAFSQEKKPLDGVTLLKEAVFQERVKNDFKKAAELYTELLKRDKVPSRLRDKARLGLAVCQMRNKDVDLAVKTFAEVFEKSPRLAEAYLSESKLFSDSSSVREYLQAKKVNKKETGLAKRMSGIVIKKIRCEDVKVTEFFKRLGKLSKEHDPTGEGVSFTVILKSLPILPDDHPATLREGEEEIQEFDLGGNDDDKKDPQAKDEDTKRDIQEPTVTMNFDNIALDQAVRMVCEQADLKYTIERNVVSIHSPFLTMEPMELQFFPIDPDMMRATYAPNEEGVQQKVDFKRVFEGFGVEFPYNPDGATSSIAYDRGTNQLVVRNTRTNLKLMERILKRLNITVPEIRVTESFVEVDVKESVLARVKQAKIDEFIMNLPETRLKVLTARTQRIRSGQEGYVYTKGDIEWNGGNGYEKSVLTMTPQVAADSLSISLALRWTSSIWNSKEDYLKEISLKEGDEVVASANWEAELRNEITIWDQESVCFKLAPAKPHLKRGALFLIVHVAIVDPSGESIRDPKDSSRKTLGAEAVETGE